jgi:hypothetical protein
MWKGNGKNYVIITDVMHKDFDSWNKNKKLIHAGGQG